MGNLKCELNECEREDEFGINNRCCFFRNGEIRHYFFFGVTRGFRNVRVNLGLSGKLQENSYFLSNNIRTYKVSEVLNSKIAKTFTQVNV